MLCVLASAAIAPKAPPGVNKKPIHLSFCIFSVTIKLTTTLLTLDIVLVDDVDGLYPVYNTVSSMEPYRIKLLNV